MKSRHRAFGQHNIGCGVWLSLIVLFFILFPVFSRARDNSRRSRCQEDLKQIAVAFAQYARDNDSRFPLATSQNGKGWASALSPFILDNNPNGEVFDCPSTSGAATSTTTDYFFNAQLAQLEKSRISNPANLISIGDGIENSPLSASPVAIARNFAPATRHLNGANYGFADGHVKWVKPEDLAAKNFMFAPKLSGGKIK